MTKLDPESPYMLYAPTAPPTSPAAPNQPTIPIHIPIAARMTVTYQDADGLKHGAIFDFPDAPQMSWQLVTYLPGIAKTLDELSADHDAKIYQQGLEQMASAPRLPSRAE